MSGVFVDTNDLLYVLPADERKANVAEAILAKGATISVQVLNEAASVCIRKRKMSLPDVHELLNGINACCEVLPLTLSIHEQALVLAERFQLSIYDALVCTAAQEARAHTLLTEDIHEGLVLGKLQLVNPFLNPG